MFPELQKKLVRLYTFSTGMILTVILIITFLFYLASQQSRREAAFADHIFTLMSKLQAETTFADSYLAQMEARHSLLIYIEENGTPFFFPGAYTPQTDRAVLFQEARTLAAAEGVYPDSRPISSDLLQSSVFEIAGAHRDAYLGNVLVTETPTGYKKLILLEDITESRMRLMNIGILYILIDLAGIFLLFLTGRSFVVRSLKPLEEMYQKQQDFAASASHELRSPLAVIRAAADAAAGDAAKPAASPNQPDYPGLSPGDAAKLTGTPAGSDSRRPEKFLDIIRSECTRGDTLIKNLLLLSSAQQERWSVHMKSFELDEMLLHLLELYEPLCKAKGGRLLLLLPKEPLPPVYADPQLCLQIFTVLLDNAIAYGLPDNGKIILKADRTSSGIAVCVTDFGPGISGEEKKRIFDPFYRQDASRNDKSHFGLGLSIAARLAGLQKLRLKATDTEGGGCTFEVLFTR